MIRIFTYAVLFPIRNSAAKTEIPRPTILRIDFSSIQFLRLNFYIENGVEALDMTATPLASFWSYEQLVNYVAGEENGV